MTNSIRFVPDQQHDIEETLDSRVGQTVQVSGMVLRHRRMAWGSFLVILLRRYCIQCVAEQTVLEAVGDVREGDAVRLEGEVVAAKIKDVTIWPRTLEIQVKKLEVLSRTTETLPVDISKKELINIDLELKLNTRPVSLRHPKERAIFKLAEGVCRGFREGLHRHGFTEIHTPKIVCAGAEGGANVFSLDYFGKTAYLAQSPQFYKQIGVGIYGRVYEIGPVFRAESHKTSRHINEYTSLDFEMGPIEDQRQVMEMHLRAIRSIMEVIRRDYQYEIEILDADVPAPPEEIPCVTVAQVHEIVGSRVGRDFTGEPDLDPIEEREICKWSMEEHGTDFLYVLAYPTKKRPFYAMDDPDDPTVTLSFDLLFRGLEITTGGQRIHDYDMQVGKMKRLGLDPEQFSSFLMLHKYGVPPHGGLGMGLERLVSRFLGTGNIRETTMFPRDLTRLTP